MAMSLPGYLRVWVTLAIGTQEHQSSCSDPFSKEDLSRLSCAVRLPHFLFHSSAAPDLT
jgi:hypothetical protein